jgi:hypothetical protein
MSLLHCFVLISDSKLCY